MADDITFFAVDRAGLFVVVSWPLIGVSVLWDGGEKNLHCPQSCCQRITNGCICSNQLERLQEKVRPPFSSKK